MRGRSTSDNLALDLWGDLYKEIPKGIFASAAWYFSDASTAKGIAALPDQTPEERFFEVWKGMIDLGAPPPSNNAVRGLKKLLKKEDPLTIINSLDKKENTGEAS